MKNIDLIQISPTVYINPQKVEAVVNDSPKGMVRVITDSGQVFHLTVSEDISICNVIETLKSGGCSCS